MAKFDTISDTFDGPSLSALWTPYLQSPSTFTFAGGYMTMKRGLGAESCEIFSTNAYDLTNSALSLEIFNLTIHTVFTLYTSGGYEFDFIITGSGGNLQCTYYVGGSFVTKSTRAYNPTTHRFLRMRYSSGTFYWDVSQNGKSWTNIDSFVTAVNVTACNISIAINPSLTGTSIDNLNLYRDLLVPNISSGSTTFAPVVKQIVKPPFRTSSIVLYAPTLLPEPLLSIPFLASLAALFTPIVHGPPQEMTIPHISSGVSVYSPVVFRYSDRILGPAPVLRIPPANVPLPSVGPSSPRLVLTNPTRNRR